MRSCARAPSRIRHFAVLFLPLAVAACAPLSAPIPFQLMQTADVLAENQVAFAVGGGGGWEGLDGSGGGVTARVRAGAGHDQELGFEANLIVVDTGDPSPKQPGWIGRNLVSFAAKAEHKWGPVPWFALLDGLGVSYSATGMAFGGDVGFVVSLPRGPVRPYGGVRLSLAIPAGRPLDSAGGVTVGLIPAIGLMLPMHPHVRAYLEAGAPCGWSGVNAAHVDGHAGVYGALGFELSTGNFR